MERDKKRTSWERQSATSYNETCYTYVPVGSCTASGSYSPHVYSTSLEIESLPSLHSERREIERAAARGGGADLGQDHDTLQGDRKRLSICVHFGSQDLAIAVLFAGFPWTCKHVNHTFRSRTWPLTFPIKRILVLDRDSKSCSATHPHFLPPDLLLLSMANQIRLLL